MPDQLQLGKVGRPPNAPRDAKGRYSKGSNAISGSPIGRGVGYIVARLARDGRHELRAQVLAGERSANSVAVSLGWIKPRKSVIDWERVARLRAARAMIG